MGEWLRVGRTEAEVGADIAAAILAEGHVGRRLHHRRLRARTAPARTTSCPTASIEAGDLVVVDIGGETATGYRSDCTRTYVVGGSPRRRGRRVVRRPAGRPGGRDRRRPAGGDGASRSTPPPATVIDDAGWGEHFIHRTGHGIGLDTHEAPYIVAGNDLPLVPGMAFSVEPGIYLAGRCGARIEDIVVCTEDGVRTLNDGPRELVELPG